MSQAVTLGQIRAQVASVWAKAKDARVIAIQVPGTLATSATLQVNGAELPVAHCDSVLAIRERLVQAEGGELPLVLLTPLSETELGLDVVARLARRHLHGIDPWQLVKERFRARFVDPRLVQQHDWVAKALLEAEPTGGFPPAPSGFIQAELVWRVLFEALLGFAGETRDAEAFLEWSLDPARRAQAQGLDETVRRSLALAAEEGGGSAARVVFECATGGRGDRAVAVGLVARVLVGPAAKGDEIAARAMGRLEAWLGVSELDEGVASAWADAAEALMSRRLAAGAMRAVRPLLEQADALLGELGAQGSAHRSGWLASGFDQRLGVFAEALLQFVKGKARTLPPALATAARLALEHALAAPEAQRAERVEMALRLSRLIAEQRASMAPAVGSFAEAARRYRAAGGHADWARSRIWDGDSLPALGRAYTALWEAVAKLRDEENQRFATLLANWSKTGSHDQSVIPVEDLLQRVVAPLATSVPVLLVVLDGMSLAVARELQQDLLRRGWVELDDPKDSKRLPVIAVFPTVTAVSRTSLFCGRLMNGTDADERKGFAKHPGLAAGGKSSKQTELFHKGSLTSGSSVGLTPAVREAIADPQRRVVGVVVNAVDDHLAKGEQLRVDWTAHRIRPLEELLDAAREAGRSLVVTSDHGHVPEHGTRSLGEEEAQRWREAAGEPGAHEVLVEGPRVALGKGNRIVAQWSDRVRFGSKRNGYHGGVAPQEVVIPLAVFASASMAVEGWEEVLPETPSWWEEGEAVVAPAALVKPAPPQKPGESGRLFPSEEELAKAAEVPGPAWIDRLFASPTYADQRAQASRVALPEERIRGILVALEERGGKLTRVALAKRLGVPELRLGGMLSALRRVLNVEGYPVLSVEESSDSVELNRGYLFTQFRL